MSEADLHQIVDHVFLPRKLPGQESPSLIQDEANILNLLSSVLNSSDYANYIPIDTRKLFETWSENQRVQNPENISNSLRKLKNGMYL